ncbi:MAG: hypothetical protein R3C28_05590 [Pirellulaceae bacterium]
MIVPIATDLASRLGVTNDVCLSAFRRKYSYANRLKADYELMLPERNVQVQLLGIGSIGRFLTYLF